jgi:hypothetical protein
MNGKNYQKKNEEPLLIKKLKTQENEGATSKYPKYTDIKIFGDIPKVFVAKKIIFFSTGHVFFRRL